MPFSIKNQKLAEQAKRFIRKNKKLLIEKFANENKYKPSKHPILLIMAGSPGAGKTEFSKNLIKHFKKPVIRIDADEIREIIPQYNGKNSDVIQGASAIGVEKLIDHVFKKKLDAVIDGTLAKYEVGYKNIKRALDKDRKVEIFYVYQKPEIAWKFSKEREILEGRKIPKQVFIEGFFNSRKNVGRLKQKFKDKVEVSIIIKDYYNKDEKYLRNVENIDKHIKIKHTHSNLNKKLLNYKHGQSQKK